MERLRVACFFIILFGLCRGSHGDACGGHFNSSNGVIKSPLYPQVYPLNTVCEWIIEDPNKNQISLNIVSFAFENCGSCTCDYLQIRDGPSGNSTLIGQFCGSTIPGNITSSGHQIYLKFRTDHSNSNSGFYLQWSSAVMGASASNGTSLVRGGHFYSSSGIITSPNYPEHYPDNFEIEWIIEAPKGWVVVLNVRKFDMEPHPQCAADFLEIRNGSSAETSTLMGRYCGRNIPEKITCAGDRVFLRFKADGSGNYEGFLIEWNSTIIIEDHCGGSLTTSHGSISSPNYPQTFTSSSKCSWDLRVSAGSVIQFIIVDLEFEAVEHCRFDFIEIYEGNDTRGKRLGTYCQTISHPVYVETTSNVANVQFRSDSANSGRRFRIIYHTVCHNKLRGSKGVIESPNFPNNYPHRENCSWTIETPTDKNLSLTFSKFELEGGFEDSCSRDFLEITEGENDEPKRKIGRFCNSTAPPTVIVTTQRQIFLQFYSDNFASKNGFRLEWAAINNSRVNIEPPIICGGHFNSSTGIIISPDYDERYPAGIVCEWIIEDPNKQRMVLNFEKFDIEQCESCECDYLEIRNGDSATSPLLGKYCGTTIPANIVSFGYEIYLKFQTDSSRSYKGFKMAWISATIDRFIGSDISDGTTRAHGGHFYSSSGILTSPNYPEDYPNNLEREWIIEVPKGHLLVLNVKKFDVQPHAQCDSDYLEIRNGSSLAASTLVGKYCGTNIPEKITCHGDRIFLRFKTDCSLGYEGFVIEWNSITIGCGGTLTAGRGSISSPYYPELYSLPIECNWNIQVSAGSIIQLILVDLEFEAAEQCRFDFIEIFDGIDSSGKNLGTYCQTINHPLYVETTSNVASVRFRSDSNTTGRRFRMIYHSICHNKLHGSEGVIESPNFPNNYPHRENCSWIIEVPAAKNLQLTFSEFDVDGGLENSCENDYLMITEGADDQPLTEIGTFCNPTAPPPTLVTTQRQVFLQFYSDNAISRKGFRLEWVVNVHNTTPPLPRSCLLWGPSISRRNDYTYTLGNVGHKFHTRGMTWNEARITCQGEGGHLAIINSIAELNAVTELFRHSDAITESAYPNLASIGFHYLYSENQFATIHDQSLIEAGFANWGSGQPDNSTGSEYCGALSITGGLNDVSCTTKYAFICELPIYRYTDTSSKNNTHQQISAN